MGSDNETNEGGDGTEIEGGDRGDGGAIVLVWLSFPLRLLLFLLLFREFSMLVMRIHD